MFTLGLASLLFQEGFPQLRTATRAEIEAALPASLKKVDPPNPRAEARYRRVAALGGGLEVGDLNKALPPDGSKGGAKVAARLVRQVGPRLLKLERLLGEGPIMAPPRRPDALIPEPARLRALAKVVSISAREAARVGDRRTAARRAILGLRLGQAALDGGGAVIDALVALSLDKIAAQTVVELERQNALDASGRRALLAVLPALDGRTPQLGEAIRRDFQGFVMPTLLKPERYFERDSAFERPVERAGTFDPVATARLYAGIYGEEIDNTRRPYPKRSRLPERLADKAAKGLPRRPDDEDGTPRPFDRAAYRRAMNAGENTIGRTMASSGVFANTAAAGTRRAAFRNAARAVLLIKLGQKSSVPDPFGEGNLRYDPKRRLVWSVGMNGKDDGGKIGKGNEFDPPDVGFRF